MIRAKAMDVDSINRYFDVLEHALKDNNLYNKPSFIFNCDETGMPLNPKSFKVIAKRGAKNVNTILVTQKVK